MKKVTGYMCKIAFDHELGCDYHGTTVYPSLTALKENHKCWEECGIVEVEVIGKEIVNKENSKLCKDTEEWLKIFPGISIIHSNGWDKNNLTKSYAERITKKEFTNRIFNSTIDTSIEAMKRLTKEG